MSEHRSNPTPDADLLRGELGRAVEAVREQPLPSDGLARALDRAERIGDDVLVGELSRAVDEVRRQPLPIDSLNRSLRRAERIASRPSKPAWWRRPRMLGIAASVFVCVAVWQFAAAPRAVFDALRSVEGDARERFAMAPSAGQPTFDNAERCPGDLRSDGKDELGFHAIPELSNLGWSGNGDRPPNSSPEEPVAKPVDLAALSSLDVVGSWDDARRPESFDALVSRLRREEILPDVARRFGIRRSLVEVRDSMGQPVAGAKIQVEVAKRPVVDLVSRANGRVVIVPGWDGIPASETARLAIASADGSSTASRDLPPASDRLVLTLDTARRRLPASLDLALVLDATGTMKDELAFLAAEFAGISKAISELHPGVEQRFALVLYRDDGDAFVTRSFDFTRSLDDFVATLRKQGAAGGGDHPEAMERGLEESARLSWRDGAETCKLLFLFADAPPRDAEVERALTAVDGLRRRGVGVYSVACAGADVRCEFVLRASALLSGGRFLFAMPPDRVAGRPADPSRDAFHVEKFPALVVRLVAGELAGAAAPPRTGDVIRTFGRPDEIPVRDRR